MLAATHVFPIISVSNLNDGIAFYTNKLGFVLDWRSGSDICIVGNSMVSLFLEVDPNFGPSSIILGVENADWVFQEWSDRGVEIAVPIETQPWGMREFTALDTFKNRIIVGHFDERDADYTGLSSTAVRQKH